MVKLLLLVLVIALIAYSRYRCRMVKLHGYYDFKSAQFYLIDTPSASPVLRVAPLATGNMPSHYVIERMDPVEPVLDLLTSKARDFTYCLYTRHRTLAFNFKDTDRQDPGRINLTLIVRLKGRFPLSLRRYKPQYSSVIRLFQNLDQHLEKTRKN
ncbi:hypothetical protein BGP77_02435 [Saccharospirillum sp. MSK14-1]|uniref:hypothetical protein n=1 Tax=Saccharospirillum sp. MSK14-1 TaxID=1897632 RepID=UPI000D3B0A7F|nr:hypothetical protein [Saccharospirillum sp. MSK14-1]PTY36190.1 hypothetical protein BGP77_02435 [Saccharospirillum sp. MSK14-1]